MTFTDQEKQIIDSHSSFKEITLEFPNNEIADIENTQVFMNTMSLEESLCDSDNIELGKCNSSLFKIRVADFTGNIEGARMNVSITYTNEDLGSVVVPFGQYILSQNPQRTADKRWRDIIATDLMVLFDVDIATWYNTVLYPTAETTRTVKYIRETLCTYIGVTFEITTLINDNLVVGKTIEPETLSARDLLQNCCEVNACFGHFDYDGVLKWVSLSSQSTEEISSYKNCEYEDYDVHSINSVAIVKEDGGLAVPYEVIPQGEERNRYTITGNALLYGYNQTELTSIAQTIYNSISFISYRPNKTEVFGHIYMPLGQRYSVNSGVIVGNEYIPSTFNSFLLKREITGTQAIYQKMESKGDPALPETQSYDIVNSIRVLQGKSAVYKRDLDSLIVEYNDFTEQTTSKFIQTANEITSIVGSTQNTWLEEHPTGTAVTIKYRNYGTPQSTVSTSDVDSIYPDYATDDLYLDIETGYVYKLTGASVSGDNTLFTWSYQYALPKIQTITNNQITQTAESLSQTISSVETIEYNLTNLSDDVDSLQRQVNNELETYVGDDQPLPSNTPASNWTFEQKKQRIGTKYYCTDGTAWQWMYGALAYGNDFLTYGNNSIVYFYWKQIEDTGMAEALSTAREALEVAEDTSDTLINNYSTTTEMQSAINRSKEEIELSVSRTYATTSQLETVDGKFANVYTSEQTEARLEETSNSITGTVSETYATKTQVGNLQVGGENLILNSLDFVGNTHFMFNNYLTYGNTLLTYQGKRICY